MEDKVGISPSGVTFRGDEDPESRRLASTTEYQQNPSSTPFPVPTSAKAAASPSPPVSSATPSSGIGSDPAKKKRGRPRKYGPDGTPNPRASASPALSPMPISSSIPLSGDYPNWERGKVRPVDHENPGPMRSYYIGANFTTHMFAVNVGEDVIMKVMSFSQQGSRAICILSATGSISNVTLHQPTTSGGTLTYEGRFDILSLSGSFMPMDDKRGAKAQAGGLSISMAGPDGRVVGGGLAGLLVAAGPVQVVMGSFTVDHEAEHNQKKPRIMETASAPPPRPPPGFTITTTNTANPGVTYLRQQIYGGGGGRGGVVEPPSSFHVSDNVTMNRELMFQGYGNLNTCSNNDKDSPSLVSQP